MRYRNTDEELREAVAASKTIRETLSRLGVVPAGGNYSTFRARIVRLNLDVSHFEYNPRPKCGTPGPPRPLTDYLSNKVGITSHALRKRLIREGVFVHECAKCHGTEWLDGPIPIELDHIDGNHENNLLSNLRLLCPNCHALTPNYRGRNIKGKKSTPLKRTRKRTLSTWNFHCTACSKPLSGKTKTGMCRTCLSESRQIFKPTKQELEQLVESLPFTQIGHKFGVSDNAVRKRCKIFGIAT